MSEQPRRVTLRHTACPDCGYAMQGLTVDPESALCPECGCNVLANRRMRRLSARWGVLKGLVALGAGVATGVALAMAGMRPHLTILAAVGATLVMLAGLVWSSAGFEAHRDSR